ncbi:MAG: outer membrane beta-barrel protein, partial [Muribaculaceae bacterium]|nr:outer membrane beta-barrel protein [Muribaculaceae bacterium]
SMTGMDTEVADFTVNDSTETVELPPIKLYDTSTVLNELLVKGVKAAVVAKEDTLEFNADSFHTTDNAVVEDLLKKMPGIEIGSDGSITATGKSISKILVNGKEIFEDDPKMATKNLSAKMVSKVQVIDRKSDQARLTGVDDGEDETVINLTVKKGMEESWFGNIKAGYGTDGRYAGNFMVNRMGDGNRVTIIGRANNTNEAGFGPGGGGAGSGINTTQMLGANFTFGDDEKFAIGGDVSYSHSSRDAENSSETMNLLPDSVSYQNSNSKSLNENHNISARLRMKWEIDPNNTLDFRPSFNYGRSYSTSQSLSELFAGDASRTKVNSQDNNQVNHGDSWTLRGDMTYVHRFPQKKGRSLSLRAEYSFSNNKQHATSFSEIIRYLLDENNQDEDLFRFTDNKTWNNNISARVTWTEPIGKPGNFVEFAYNINSRRNNADKFVYDLPLNLLEGTPGDYIMPDFGSLPVGGELSDILSNSFRNDFLTQSIRAGYVRTTKDMNLNAGIELTPSSSKSIDLINSARNIPRRNVLNFAPYMRFRYKFSRNSSMQIRYNARSSQPSMTQLQPVEDVSDPMNIKVGNPDLKPTFTQRLFAMFNDYDMETQRAISGMINGSYTINNIISKTTTDPTTGARTSTYTNTSGNFNVMARGMFNQPLRNKNWRIFANLMLNYGTSDSYINGLFNHSGNFNIRPRAGVTFSTEIIQISANPTYSWQLATNSLANQPNRTNSSYGFDTDLTLIFPFGLQFTTDLNFSKTNGLSAGYDTKSWIWDASLQYTIPGTYGLNVFVEAHDHLDDNKNISRNVSDAAITD